MNVTKWTICNFVQSAVARGEWVTTAQIAHGTALCVNNVRQHMAPLVTAGYLQRGNGCPKLYRWADDAPPLPTPTPDRIRITRAERDRQNADAAVQWTATAIHQMVSRIER
ncbi:hypothetical protein [Burkholderia ambifaria]|uniref:hypothetical protein n=1 Tax=Burkholderia ambifaria TaxID=152480 RepID=UPI0015928213|nr:hypothetical protein [Burkholderia ambifaria]